jgi:signal transduction histidine kinase
VANSAGFGPVFTASQVAMLVIDSGGTVHAANGAAERLLDRPGGDMVGHHICSVLVGCPHGADCTYATCPARGPVLAPGQRGPLPVVPRSGPGYTLDATASALDLPGADEGLLVTLEDARVVEAARRRDFLAFIAHELRTPITIAMSHAELLADSGDSFDQPTRVEMAQEMLSAVERLSDLVDDLALLGLAGAGGLPPDQTPVDLAVSSADALQAQGVPAVTAAELVAGLRDLPRVRAGARHTGRAVAELVINGRRAMEGQGEPEVTGRVEGDVVVVRVVDRGPPVSEPDRATIFDRLARPIGQPPQGRVTPLGVTVARALVEAMGGSIGMQLNENGPGCTLWLSLPRA